MKAFRAVLMGLVAVVSTAGSTAGRPSALDDPWLQYADPVQAGCSADGLADARALAEGFQSGAVMVVRGEHVVAAWGDVTQRWKVYSARKSLLSLLYGPWVDEGAIDLSATLADLPLPDGLGLTAREEEATLESLLSARSGIYLPAARETQSAEERRPERGAHAPDSHWYYNNWDFNASGWLFEKLTAVDLATAVTGQLAEPLGFDDWRPADVFYQREPGKSPIPGFGFRMSTRDLARVGVLLAGEGRWAGSQVVSEEWIRRSTTSRSELVNSAGYGYMWWIDGKGWLARHLDTPVMDRVYDIAAVGAQGQLVLVVPESDLVIVHRGDTDHGRSVSDPDMLTVAEAVLAACQGPVSDAPDLVPLHSDPFPYDEPPIDIPEAIALPAAEMSLWVGEFASPGPRFTTFTWQDGLFIGSPGRSEVELFATTRDHLFAEALPIHLEVVERDGGGRVLSFRITMPTGDSFVAARVES